MVKGILKKFGEKLKRKGVEVTVTVKVGEVGVPKIEEAKKIKRPIYFE